MNRAAWAKVIIDILGTHYGRLPGTVGQIVTCTRVPGPTEGVRTEITVVQALGGTHSSSLYRRALFSQSPALTVAWALEGCFKKFLKGVRTSSYSLLAHLPGRNREKCDNQGSGFSQNSKPLIIIHGSSNFSKMLQAACGLLLPLLSLRGLAQQIVLFSSGPAPLQDTLRHIFSYLPCSNLVSEPTELPLISENKYQNLIPLLCDWDQPLVKCENEVGEGA